MLLDKSWIIWKYIASFLAYKALPRLTLYVFMSSRMALFLASIILDDEHEKSVEENIFFPYKLRLEMKETKVFPLILLVKSSGNKFIFLPVFYLIISVMKASKNFGKRAILKIWELISLGGVKTHFGKIALKWCIFRHEKML